MKPLQALVLLVAIVAGLCAALLVAFGEPEATPTPVVATHMAPADTTEILVAANDLPMWQVLGRGDLRWQAWPSGNVPKGAIIRDRRPQAEGELFGQMTRTQFAGGEPLRMERLMDSDAGTGFLSAMLPSGKRALAINIDTRGRSSAGGLIHPNDRVDIIRIFAEENDDERPNDGFLSETLFTNIRVLAIGQAVQTSVGDIAFHGDTATVEVTPAQAEALTLAQRTDQLTLALRSFADAQDHIPAAEPASRSVTVTSGGSGGFNSTRFAVSQSPTLPLEADTRSGQAGDLAGAGWIEREIRRYSTLATDGRPLVPR